MKKNGMVTLGALVVGLRMASAQAWAVPTTYSSEAAYNAATSGDQWLIDFNGSAGGYVDGSTISLLATFGSPEASNPALVNWNSDKLSDAGSTLTNNSVGPLSISFSTATHAFGLEFSSTGQPNTVDLYDSTSTLIASVSGGPAVPEPSAALVFGLGAIVVGSAARRGNH